MFFFDPVDNDSVSIAVLDKLSPFCFCNLTQSTEEHRFLVDLLFDRKGEYGIEGVQRRRTLALLLSLVELAQKHAPADVGVNFARGALYGRTLAGRVWAVPSSFEATADAWQTYQRNDLLSTVMQTMFAIALQVLEQSSVPHFSAEEFANWFVRGPGVQACITDLGVSTFQAAVQQVARTLPPQGDWENPQHEFQTCLAMLTEYGNGADRGVVRPVFAAALRVMLALAYRTRDGTEYRFSPFTPEFLRDHPINLESFRANIAVDWQHMTLEELLVWLISEWGITTHLRVALRKLRANPQATFRVRPSERGMQVMEGIPPPAPTNPRLRQALQILRDIAAIEHDGPLRLTRLTDLGSQLLKEASVN
jgi:hypothetical protein